MRTAFSVFGIVLSFTSFVEATWSVIAVDKKTRDVAISSATCVPHERFARFPAKGLMDIQAIVVPGKGVAAAQAAVDNTRKNQELIFREIQKGTSPDAILALLKEDPQIERRQFAVVDLEGRRAGFSGSENGASSLDEQGEIPDEGIVFSIQGNILAGPDVVHAGAQAFRDAKGSLTDRVMAAMEAADAKGGDRRCTCETEPKPNAPCDGKTAHVAYVLLAKADDTNGASFNDGKYSFYVSVTDQDVLPAENANPVKTLRLRYEAWKKTP